jgi:putative tryptophan/tyrosine transport system substrate-binding protein
VSPPQLSSIIRITLSILDLSSALNKIRIQIRQDLASYFETKWPIRLKLKNLITIFFILICWSNFAFAENQVHILIVDNSYESPYQETVAGFKKQLSAPADIKFTELTFLQAKVLTQNEIEHLKPDLIYALGSDSIQWASSQITRIPIVASMALKDDLLRQSANITGVKLRYSIKTQLQLLKKFFSQKKTIAILFNPNENAKTVEEISKVSHENGFNMVAIPVESPKNLPFALEQMANNVEIMFAIPDETVMSIKTAKELLLASFRNKVPLVGLSDNWVKSGAFYALSWDFEDLGRQCGSLAEKLLKGVSIQSIPPEYPRKVTYTINAKIAEQMNMQIPEDLLKGAKIVFN